MISPLLSFAQHQILQSYILNRSQNQYINNAIYHHQFTDSQYIYIQFHMQESAFSLKRREFRVEIRRKQIEQKLKKRRYELIVQNYLSGSSETDDGYKLSLILQLIRQYPLECLNNKVIQLIQLDPSLDLFLELSNYTIKSLPNKFKHIIQNTLDIQIDQLIINQNQFYSLPSKISIFQCQLTQIFCSLQLWWSSNNNAKLYYNILVIIKQMQDYNYLVHPIIIQFLSFVTNILLMAQRMAKAFNLESKTVVGDHPMQIQLQISKCILLNILGIDKEQLLCPILPQFLKFNGHAIEMTELYYNLFLIKQVQPETRIEMLQSFISLLQDNPQETLQNYRDYIFMLYSSIKNNNIPTDTFYYQRYEQLCNRMINLIGNLLKVINFNLNDSSSLPSDNHKIKIHLSYILRHLSESKNGEERISNIIQHQSITQFMCAALKHSTISQHQLIASYNFQILNRIATSNQSKIFFENQQPRVFALLVALLNKYQQIQIKQASELQYDKVLKKVILIILNLCIIDSLASRFLQENVVVKVCNIYHILNREYSTSKAIKVYIEELLVNLFVHIKNHPSHYINSHLIFCFFDQLQPYSVMLEMLKFTQSKSKIVISCLSFWIFVINEIQNLVEGNMIYKFMRDNSALSRLRQLQTCQNQLIQNYARYLINQLQQQRSTQQNAEDNQLFYNQIPKADL